MSGRYAPFSIKGYSPELERLVSQMLTVDVTKRISVEQILSSPIVARQLGTLKASPDYQHEFSASMMNEQAVLNKFQLPAQVKQPVQMFIPAQQQKA